MKKNKKCPVCRGHGTVKVVKPVAHFLTWHLGKDQEELCYFCNLQEINEELEQREEKNPTLH